MLIQDISVPLISENILFSETKFFLKPKAFCLMHVVEEESFYVVDQVNWNLICALSSLPLNVKRLGVFAFLVLLTMTDLDL